MAALAGVLDALDMRHRSGVSRPALAHPPAPPHFVLWPPR